MQTKICHVIQKARDIAIGVRQHVLEIAQKPVV